jgi:phosphatidylglycerophosphate synthase
MTVPQPPSPDEARTSLDEIAEARRATAEATRRPAWVDAIYAAVSGIGVGIATSGQLILKVIGLAIILGGYAVITAVDKRGRRRHGRVLDSRSVRSQVLRFVIPFAALFMLISVPDTGWQPWYAIGAGLVITVAGFVYLRLDERYQVRRLAAGDYDRYNLI